MKKILLAGLAAAAALAVTGCSNEEAGTPANTADNAIAFGTYLGRASRAAVYANDDLKKDGFGVFAFQSSAWSTAEPDFMVNQKIEWKDGAWTYSPTKYWADADQTLSFFAYAPYDAAQTWAGTKSLSFTVAADVKSQKDFLVADARLSKKRADGDVKFNFKHALSRIGFTVTPNKLDAATTITITKIEMGRKQTDGTIGAAFYTAGTRSLDAAGTYGAWTGSGTQTFTLQSANFAKTDFTTADAARTALNAADSYTMVVPQDFTTDGFDVAVTYTVTVKEEGKADVVTTATSVANVKLDLLEGKAYTLNINLVAGTDDDGNPTPGLLYPIVIDADMTDWVDAGSTDLAF